MKAGGVRLLEGGAIGSAIAASICCVGPLALALLGLGGGAILVALAPYRPIFIGACALFLGAAFYAAYKPTPAAKCAPGSACAATADRRRQRFLLWFITVVTVLVVTFPAYSRFLF
ncbi:MAG TPA: mercuric transporter MerT family protein [Thermoanaerobaculia bacterium]|jgi:mercuric ion transport protein